MKVGFHVDESLESIITRKQTEERTHGKIFWGYGGTLCHPVNKVHPFIRETKRRKLRPILVLSVTSSKFVTTRTVAGEYSVNGEIWYPVPPGICVSGSRYAIVCKNLRQFDKEIDLSMYVLATGPKKGISLADYIRSRVDKACAFMCETPNVDEKNIIKVSYVAEIVEPYAVFVR